MKLSIKPHGTLRIPIEVGNLDYRYGTYLTCRLYRLGEEIAVTQHSLIEQQMDSIEPEKTANIASAEVEESDSEVIFSGEGFQYSFSKRFGSFTSMRIDGKEQLAEPVRLTSWRAPTDNDRNIRFKWGNYNVWQGENLDKLFQKVYNCRRIQDGIRVEGSLAGVSRKPFFHFSMQISVDVMGKITVKLDGNVREDTVYLPRLGFEFVLLEKNMPFRYYGCGPYESYCDMHHAGTVGMYESTAEQEYVPYVRPQEHGNHTAVKMLEIGKLHFEFTIN